MGGIIDFNTDCPWQLYTFAFLHAIVGILMYFVDTCRLLSQTSTPCTESEFVMARFMALSMLYIGVLFTVLTYHNKRSPAKITTLSNMALNGAVAVLVSTIFIGNASYYGGFERSWMHIGDVITFLVLVAILLARVSESNAEWARKNPLGDGLGVNCKSLLFLCVLLTTIKLLAYTDFIDPKNLLADGFKMTHFASWMWKFLAVLIFEALLAFCFALFFEDEAGQELVVSTVIVMTLIAAGSLVSVLKYMSDWRGMNGTGLWIRLVVMIGVCLVAIVGGRLGGTRRAGYQGLGEGAR